MKLELLPGTHDAKAEPAGDRAAAVLAEAGRGWMERIGGDS